MKKFVLFLIAIISFHTHALNIKTPAINELELKAYSAELKFLKKLKREYQQKNRILDSLRIHSKSLIKAQKSYLKKRSVYKKNITHFKNPNIKNLKISSYVSRVRNVLYQQRFLTDCFQRELNRNHLLKGGKALGILKINSSGNLENLKFTSPNGQGIRNKRVLNCLSQNIKKLTFPLPPHNKPISILQAFNFKVSG